MTVPTGLKSPGRGEKKKSQRTKEKRKKRKETAKRVCVVSDELLGVASGAVLSHFVII